MGSHTGTSRALIAIALYVGVGVRLAHAAPGDIYNLGTLGGTDSYGNAINASGQVAGSSDTSGSAFHAFRYTGTPGSGGAMADLGTLGGTRSVGYSINEAGQVAGWSEPTVDAAPAHAFRYTGTPGSGGAMADLGTLGGTFSLGYAINASGQVAGYGHTTGNSAYHAFRTAPNAVIDPVTDDLGTLGGTDSYGYAINASGQVAGQSYTGRFTHAFRYTGTPGSGGAMADLGTLGGLSSFGYAINASGQVTGTSTTTVAIGPASHAFRTAPNAVINPVTDDLGTLGGRHSYGYAINASGQVAGYSNTTGTSANHAFLYTGTPGVDGLMIDLDAWLDATNPTEGAKWTLTEARGLSDAGLITGTGVYNDGVGGLTDGGRAFILDASSLVPESSTFVLASLGLSSILLRRVRRRVRARRIVADAVV